MNTPVRPQLARLLKEKGFDEYVKLCVAEDDNRALPFDTGNSLHKNSLHPYYSAPTVAEVVMWLYEKHGIWVEVRKTNFFKEIRFQSYMNENPLVGNLGGYISHSQPTQSYEAAIEYCLINLI